MIGQPIGTSREIHFEFPHLKLFELELEEFAGIARVTRTPQGLLVQGDFAGKLLAECVRCLAEFLQPLHTSFSELYAFKFKGMTDSGLILPEDSNIDLGPLAREYFLLEVPISPLCKPDCKGLCVYCGADLNNEVCEHHVITEHPRGTESTNL